MYSCSCRRRPARVLDMRWSITPADCSPDFSDISSEISKFAPHLPTCTPAAMTLAQEDSKFSMLGYYNSAPRTARAQLYRYYDYDDTTVVGCTRITTVGNMEIATV
jgi:hypothetical protein